MSALLVLGNPLLDIAASVDEAFLSKYGLKSGNAILAEPSHLPIYDEIVKTGKVDYIAGGAAQNSARVAQWMLGGSGNVTYVGCVGNDDNGKTLKKVTEEAGVKTLYQVEEGVPTGTCAVLVTNKERSLVTNLGAANCYKKAHFEANITPVMEAAKYFYATGYFLTVSPETYEAVGKHAVATNKVVLFNLAAPFVIQFFTDKLKAILAYSDVVFSNDDEAKVLGQTFGWGSDIKEIAKNLAQYEKHNQKRSRVVVFTQGANPTIVFQDGVVSEHPVPPVPSEQIVDTNGAGDAFAGGFLALYVQSKPIEKCVQAGHYAASEIIRRPSCTYPPSPSFSL
eukprot:TRINITY_DN684_c0_g1_i1.p1 TRINITY_DN684_c0_g1~~TRINITY_DN684_c0_g1_i1.p1  ORF type:complete len:338 (+),score=134.20 TRINITY_DN684_c0_g1_i1:94-1107(+)